MRHRLLIFSLVLVALAASAAFGRGTALASGTEASPRWPVFEYPGADNIYVTQQCLPDGTVLINVNWQGYNLGYQWIDLSLYNNGWVWGTFLGLGPLVPNANSQPWGGLLPDYWHYLRVNTLTSFGWWPSQTVQFFTRTDCYYQPPLDSDGDGVPNNQDFCPNQHGSPLYGGCPIPQSPPGGMCGGGWCPGQPAPPQFCPSQPQIQIFPPPAAGCVWVTRGENATYALNEEVIVCYWVSQPMYILVQTQRPDGTFVNVAQGNDDGRGNCQAGTAGTPTGPRTTRLYGSNNQLLDETVWYVQSAGGEMCGGGWCPGEPPPAQYCGAFVQVVPQVIGPQGCVWVTKGENSSYVVGEQVITCYWVSQPMYILVQTQRPDGTFVNVAQGNDDGRGNCLAGTAGVPTGQRTTRLYTLNSQILDQTVWYVQ